MAAETEFDAAMQRARESTAALTETATQLAAAVRRAEQLQQLGWCRVCGCACLPLSSIHPWCKTEEIEKERAALDRSRDAEAQP